MNKPLLLYVCNKCGNKISDPIYSYKLADGTWINNTHEDYSNMAYIHAANTLISCDECGSHDLFDPDTKENLNQSI